MTAARPTESTTLRTCLIQADRQRRRAQLTFDQLQAVLDATYLPMLD